MIRRLLPSPLLTLALIVMWLMLNRSISAGARIGCSTGSSLRAVYSNAS